MSRTSSLSPDACFAKPVHVRMALPSDSYDDLDRWTIARAYAGPVGARRREATRPSYRSLAHCRLLLFVPPWSLPGPEPP
jgi:hypothetical protein